MILLSHSHHDKPQVDELKAQLEARGLRVWIDSEKLPLGQPIGASLKDAVAGVQGMLIWVTPNALASNYVVTREFGWGMEQQRKNPSFFVIPVCVGVDYAAANQVFFRASGYQLPLALAEPQLSEGELILKTAHQVLRAYCTRLGQHKPEGVHLALSSKKYDKLDPAPDFDLNFTNWFNNERPTHSLVWSHVGMALYQVYTELGKEVGSLKWVRISGRYHISLAFLVGSIFDQTSGIELLVEHKDGRLSSRAPRSGLVHLTPEPTVEGDGLARDVILQFSVTGDVGKDVLNFAGRRGLNYSALWDAQVTDAQTGERLTIDLDLDRDGTQLAADAHRLLKQARQTATSNGTVHFFAAIPIALAVLIGQKTNAQGPIQLYELPNAMAGHYERLYEPSLIIG